MHYLFFLGHPAHFHLFKNTIYHLKERGNRVSVLIKKKDILDELLKRSGLDYVNVLPDGRADGKVGIAISVLKKDWELLLYCLKNRPDMMLGTSAEIAHIGKLIGIPSLNFSEDDVDIIKTFARLTYPFATHVFSPIGCNNNQWNNKTVRYNGYHKLAYLHPNRFQPDEKIVRKYIDTQKPYYLLRFAKLNAHHDEGAVGISTDLARQIIDILREKGNVYISSERTLEPEFEQYRLNIDPLDIHHVLSFADIYIGDSQSMAVEATMLGTPSLRFSNFSGHIGVLEDLEHKYDLTHGFKANDAEGLLGKITEYLSIKNLKTIFYERKIRMLSEKIDVTAFFIWFIENYPESIQLLKNTPDFQNRFK